jgi:hypothetical protein
MSETWLNMSMPSTPRWPSDDAGVPSVDGRESFGDLVDKLSQQVPSSSEASEATRPADMHAQIF